MDKNTILGMLLMGLVLFGFMYCNKPEPKAADDPAKQEQEALARAQQALTDDSLAVATLTPQYRAQLLDVVRKSKNSISTSGVKLNASTTDSIPTVQGHVTVDNRNISLDAIFDKADTTVTFAQRARAAKLLAEVMNVRAGFGKFGKFLNPLPAKAFTVHTENMDITFDPRGGRMSGLTLNKYDNEYAKDHDKVRLFTPDDASYAFNFLTTEGQRVSTREMHFTPTVNADSTKVTMKLELDANTWLAYTYTIDAANYVVHLDVTQQNMATAIQGNTTGMGFDWRLKLERNEVGRTFEEQKSGLYYKMKDESPDDLSANEKESKNLSGAIKWVAFKNQFFSAVVIARGTYFTNANVSSSPYDRNSEAGQRFLKDLSMEATFDYNPNVNGNVIGLDFYLGPNSYTGLSDVSDMLQQQAGDDESLELNRLVPLGWGIFGWINRFLVIPIFNFLGSFIGSYGLIILVLTIIIKIILFPFTYKSYMSQAKMRVLAPEINEINEKYPGQENAMKRQQETMKLYSRAGASPFSGCLPMLLQLPVLIALFSFFPSAIELRGQSFLWVHSLAAPDYICTLPFTIPFYGNQVSLFCLLMTVTNIIYTRISMASNPTAGMGGMKWMTYLMPIMFLFFFNDYAAGLSYYYFISLLITIAQTYVCRKVVSEDKVRAQMMENARKPRKKKGFMARLEAAQKKQEAMMRQQAKERANRRR